jgi:LuxR family transcriptional regulator, maltose regulon positive regulatory protein
MDSPFGRQIDIKFNRMWNDATLIDLEPLTSKLLPAPPMAESLSERELEVLRLKCEGLTNPEIAAKLVVARSTVKKHINNMYGKLGVSSPTQAVRKARELGLG